MEGRCSLAGAMSELIGRIGALQLITKDQIMNLAVELLPPARVRELMSHLGVLVGFLQGSRALAFWRTQQFPGSSKPKAFDSKPCPGVQCRIPVTKQNMKLSAGTGGKLSSLMCRTVTFYDSGGGQLKHMERTFLQIRDTQRERLDQGEREGGKGSGGVTPPPPPPPSRKRQTGNGDWRSCSPYC